MNRHSICSILLIGAVAGTCFGLEKEASLVTGEKIGNLAVAGKAKAQNYKPSTIAEIPEKKTLKNIKSHFSQSLLS